MSFPTKPTYAVAQNAYQVLLELCRKHPHDEDLKVSKFEARALMEELWRQEVEKRC